MELAARQPTLPDLDTLRGAGVPLPDAPSCVYLSGSFASGMAHASSDFDVFVITAEPFMPENPTGMGHASVEPASYPIVIRQLPAGRCDIEYWQQSQVSALLAKFAPGNATLGFTVEDVDFLYRLAIALPLSDDGWLQEHKAVLAASEFASMVAQRSFGTADSLFEDALGMLAVGDCESAVLAAHEGFGRAVDGLLASLGEFSPRRKWRARKFLRVQPALMDFAEYWAVETMRGFDPDAPASWVREVIERARELMMEVELS
jgi:hypothetical protein